MDKDKLQEILRLHKLWLDNDIQGKRADLSGANLSDTDPVSYTHLNLGVGVVRGDIPSFRAEKKGLFDAGKHLGKSEG